MAVITLREDGVAGTLRALKLLDKDLAKGLEKEINDIGGKIVADAKDLIPGRPPSANGGELYNWRATGPRRSRATRTSTGSYGTTAVRGGKGWPGWIEAAMDSSVRKSRREFVVTARSTDAAAMIYEIAGTKTSGRSPQGRAFIANLPALPPSGGRRGRVLVRSVKMNYRAAKDGIKDVTERAQAACRERLGN